MTKTQMSVERLIELCDKQGDFVTGEDGYVVFWPSAGGGAFSEWVLRALADELEKRNAAWHAKVMEELSGPMGKTS